MKNTLDKKIKIQYDVIRKLEITNQKQIFQIDMFEYLLTKRKEVILMAR